jgi:cell division protein FtsB
VKWLTAVLLILLLVLQYRLWIADSGAPELRKLYQALEEQRLVNDQLEARNSALQAEVEDLKKGLSAIEERAREDLGMIKEGETFFQIVETPEQSDPKPALR